MAWALITVCILVGDAVNDTAQSQLISDDELGFCFTPYDLKRLESYASNLVDYHMIIDLVPQLARIYFENKAPSVNLSHAQSAILCLLGLQHQTMEKRTGPIALVSTDHLTEFDR